jgi:hypothetical protein
MIRAHGAHGMIEADAMMIASASMMIMDNHG